ncbi:MAG: hypothetical protein FJ284_05140 [Planctomycetes bacterium]|nr:hypothetical protein [Planctomycetota bacterium]
MIKDLEAYRRQSDRDRWESLARMTPEESIAVGEAVLTSEIMRLAVFPDDVQPRSVAVAPGITPHGARGQGEDPGGRERV